MKQTHGAFILARYSTDNQEQDSIEVQVQRCTAWCDKNNLPVLDIFADYAVSGMKDTRPQYQRMMDALAQGKASTVVIYDQSRMFRKMTAWFQFRDELECLGVRVVSVTQPMIGGDLRDPTNFLTEGSMALFNQMWVLQTRQKVVEKMRFMAKNGLHTGGPPPLGFKVVEQRLEIEPTEAPIVQRIFTMYADGSSYRQIAQQLNDQGIRTRRGGPFGANSLHDLLTNKKYIGTLVYGKTAQMPDGSRNSHRVSPNVIEIENGCPAIIDRGLFDKVQEKMLSRRHTGGRPPINDALLLRGKVFCGDCGSAMSVHYSGGNRKYAYYACAAQKRNHICSSKPINAYELENSIAGAILENLGQPQNRADLISILRRQREDVQGSAAQTMRALMARRAEISKQLDNATAAILGGLASETLISKMNALENERQGLDYRINELHANVQRVSLPDDVLERTLDEIIHSAETGNTALLSIVYRVEITADLIKVWTVLDCGPDGDKHKKIHIPPSDLPHLTAPGFAHNCLQILGSTKNPSCASVKDF